MFEDLHVQKVSLFISKLWNMVVDESINDEICWNETGTSFIIRNPINFSYEILPQYFKHNNLSSFVRQLNMYGFHKVLTIDNGTIVEGSKEREIQFYHPFFQKDSPELLENIKRSCKGIPHQKVSANLVKPEQTDFSKLLSEIQQLRDSQNNCDNQLVALKKENTILWQELASLKEKYLKQSNILNNLVQFLVTMVQKQVEIKRRLHLQQDSQKSNENKSESNVKNNFLEGLIIEELDTNLDSEESPESDIYNQDEDTCMSTDDSSTAMVTWDKSNSSNSLMEMDDNSSQAQLNQLTLYSLIGNNSDSLDQDVINSILKDVNLASVIKPKSEDKHFLNAILPSTSTTENCVNCDLDEDVPCEIDDEIEPANFVKEEQFSEGVLNNDPMFSGYDANSISLNELFDNLAEYDGSSMLTT